MIQSLFYSSKWRIAIITELTKLMIGLDETDLLYIVFQ